MHSLKFMLLVCLIVSAVYDLEVNTKGVRNRNKKLYRQYQLNEQLLRREGRCEPKIRLSYILDHPSAVSGIHYYPRAAVLHVCERTGGCCYESAHHHCLSAEEEQVEIVITTKGLHQKQHVFQTFTFTNHTQCACKNISDRPN